MEGCMLVGLSLIQIGLPDALTFLGLEQFRDCVEVSSSWNIMLSIGGRLSPLYVGVVGKIISIFSRKFTALSLGYRRASIMKR